MTYILVYNVDDYPDMDGGVHVDSFKTASELDIQVERIMIEGHSILHAGELHEYTYRVVEVIKKVVRE